MSNEKQCLSFCRLLGWPLNVIICIWLFTDESISEYKLRWSKDTEDEGHINVYINANTGLDKAVNAGRDRCVMPTFQMYNVVIFIESFK